MSFVTPKLHAVAATCIRTNDISDADRITESLKQFAIARLLDAEAKASIVQERRSLTIEETCGPSKFKVIHYPEPNRSIPGRRFPMGTAYPTPARGKKLTISYGLVNVGVKYAPLVQEQRTKGHYVDPDTLGPVKQQYVRESDGQVVKPVSAYDHPSGPVVLSDRGALESKRDGRLELTAYVPEDSVDPLYFEQTYLVWPDKGHEAGYDLLCEALESSGNWLMGTGVLTKSTKAVVLRYGDGCLLAHVCTYDANIAWGEHRLVVQGAADRPAPDPALVSMAKELFASLPDVFDFSTVEDEYDARLREAIEAQAAGKPIPVSEELEPAQVLDLMEALKASVAAAKEPKKEPAKKKRTKAAAKKKS